MMKSMSFVFVCLFGLSAFAQHRSQGGDARRMAEQVDILVQQSLHRLPLDHQQYVRESLRGIIQSFVMNGVDVNVGGGQWGNPPPPPPPYQPARQLFCDSSGNTLNDLLSGRLIYDFSNIQDCNTAKSQVLRGEPFCDSSGNTLHSPEARLIYDFSNIQDCQSAREAVLRGRGFCDSSGNTLHRADGTLVYDFSNPQDCQNALREMR